MKNTLESLKEEGLITSWELPYENLLTRLNAAIFFLTPKDDQAMEKITHELTKTDFFYFRLNTEGKLSSLKYRVTFNQEVLEAARKNVEA